MLRARPPRHPLAQLGYRVTGLDRSHGFLARAAALAAGRGQTVDLVAADMRRLLFADGRVDAVVNLFNAFGYLESDAEDERVLAEVARVLKPGGSFLQELANREAVVRGWHDSDVLRPGLALRAVHGDLDGGPLELDSGFVVTLSGRAGKGFS